MLAEDRTTEADRELIMDGEIIIDHSKSDNDNDKNYKRL